MPKRSYVAATLPRVLTGALVGAAMSEVAVRANGINFVSEPAVLLYGINFGIGVGLALGAAEAIADRKPGRRRMISILSGIAAIFLGFALLGTAVYAVVGVPPWDTRWLPSLYLLQTGELGLVRMLIVAGLALGGGLVAWTPLEAGLGPFRRALRVLLAGIFAAGLAGLGVLVTGEVSLRVWLHVLAVAPLAAFATILSHPLERWLEGRSEPCAAPPASP